MEIKELVADILLRYDGSTALPDNKNYIIGHTRFNHAIALVHGPLTMKIHKKILEEVVAGGYKKPVHIHEVIVLNKKN